MVAKRELFKSADVCEITQLQPYVLRSWEAEFPGLGKPASPGPGRVYRRSDVDLVLRIKDLVFVEGLTLSGARRRLEEEQQSTAPATATLDDDDLLGDMARSKLREVRAGLESILQILNREPQPAALPELQLVAPSTPGKGAASKRRRAS